VPKGRQQSFEGPKKTFSSRHGLCNILFLSLDELGICLQNLICTRGVEHWKKIKLFSTRGNAEIHIQRPFFNNKKGIQKIVDWKSKR
jgi:hypothetical protein